MNKLVDFVENLARYFKARHVGELALFALSVLLLTWSVTITLIHGHDLQTLNGIAKSIQYFVLWLLAMTVHSIVTLVTLTVFIKGWGKKRLIVLCLFFQGISLLVLFLFLPLN